MWRIIKSWKSEVSDLIDTKIKYFTMATSLDDGDFLWRECASWLTRCKIIPPDHNVNSDISLLAKTLRDGVLLCNLLRSLDSNSIDVRDYHKKPQGAQVIDLSCYSLDREPYHHAGCVIYCCYALLSKAPTTFHHHSAYHRPSTPL